MATEKNITMKQFNGTDYDTLYPKTKVEQVEDAYSQQQILADSTKGLYGLGTDAVPDDVFAFLSKAALLNEDGNVTDFSGTVKGVQIETGSYVGTGTTGKELVFDSNPYFIFVSPANPTNYGSYAAISQFIAIKGQTNIYNRFSSQSNGSTITTISFSEKKCSWGAGFNDSGTTYYYLAICKEAFA